MFYVGAPGFGEMGLAALGAAILGYCIAWLIDRGLLRLITEDRVSAILLSFALTFVVLMGAASFALTWFDPWEGGPIVIPPFGYAVAFIAGLVLAAILRMRIYAAHYEGSDEQVYFEPDYDDLSRYDQEVIAWDEKNAGRNYFRRHWAGHLSLPVSYWVNSAVFSAIILFSIEMLSAVSKLTGRRSRPCPASRSAI